MCGIFSAGSAGVDLARRRRRSSRSPRSSSSPGRAWTSAACRRRCRGTAAPLRAPRSSSASRMPGTASRPRAAVGKAPTPGSTMRSAAATISGSAVRSISRVDAGLARGALEGLGGRAQVARAVVDDGDAHCLAPPRNRSRPSRAGWPGAAPAGRVPACPVRRASVGDGRRRLERRISSASASIEERRSTAALLAPAAASAARAMREILLLRTRRTD